MSRKQSTKENLGDGAPIAKKIDFIQVNKDKVALGANNYFQSFLNQKQLATGNKKLGFSINSGTGPIKIIKQDASQLKD